MRKRLKKLRMILKKKRWVGKQRNKVWGFGWYSIEGWSMIVSEEEEKKKREMRVMGNGAGVIGGCSSNWEVISDKFDKFTSWEYVMCHK